MIMEVTETYYLKNKSARDLIRPKSSIDVQRDAKGFTVNVDGIVKRDLSKYFKPKERVKIDSNRGHNCVLHPVTYSVIRQDETQTEMQEDFMDDTFEQSFYKQKV